MRPRTHGYARASQDLFGERQSARCGCKLKHEPVAGAVEDVATVGSRTVFYARAQRRHGVNGGLFINLALMRVARRIERHDHRDLALAATAHPRPPPRRLITLSSC